MNYKKLPYKPLTPELKLEVLAFAEAQLNNKVKFDSVYRAFNTTNPRHVGFIESEEEYTRRYGVSGAVSFYLLPSELQKKLIEYFSDTPELKEFYFKLQVVTSGTFIGAHIDDRTARQSGPLYILKAGGSNVTTEWYKTKDEYKRMPIPDKIGIPYDQIDLVESHVLEEDHWHWLNYSSIHGVKNLENTRLALAM